MAEVAKPHETKEEKAVEKAEEKEQKEREKAQKVRAELIDRVVKDLTKHIEETRDWSVLDEIKLQVASLGVVAAGAELGASPVRVRELVEKHTPFIAPLKGNIMDHESDLEEQKKKTA